MRKKKIGLFFGTFNPIHNGHLIMANYILNHTDLDEIKLIVSPDSPFKEHSFLAPFEKRILMADTATSNHPSINVSDVENKLPKPTYTINTLRYLKEKYGEDCEFTVIIGADNLVGLSKFKDADEIIANYRIIVCPRNDIDTYRYINDIHTWFYKTGVYNIEPLICVPNIEISSTFIRIEVSNLNSIRYYVPESIEKMVKDEYLSLNRYKGTK